VKLHDVGDSRETVAVGSSALRKKLASTVTENEVRYKGVKTSRAKLDLLGPASSKRKSVEKGKRKHDSEDEDDEESEEENASDDDTGAGESFMTADARDDDR
jgi:hypothetical protein